MRLAQQLTKLGLGIVVAPERQPALETLRQYAGSGRRVISSRLHGRLIPATASFCLSEGPVAASASTHRARGSAVA